MKPIQALDEQVRRRFPSANTTLDPARQPTGPWFLDIELNGRHVAVEWRPDRGFGVSSDASSGYGEGPDEVYPDLEPASRRVITLLLAEGRTAETPPMQAVQ